MATRRPDPRAGELIDLLSPPPGQRPWFGGASPLGCLRGVTPKVAAWKPYPDGRSLWEQALHMAYWIYAVRRSLDGTPKGSFPRDPSNWPALPDVQDEGAWKRDRSLLKDEFSHLLDAIRALSDSALDAPAPGKSKYRVIDLLYGVVQHNTHHAAQIQLLKRLYRSRHG